MKLLSFILAILILTPLNYDINIIGNSVYGNACRYNIQGYIYVHIEGSPYERGYQHGYLLYAEIIDMLYRWSNIIHNSPVIMKYLPIDINSSQYEKLSYLWWEACRKVAIKIFWPYYPEEYREEIKGIAAGVRARNVKFYGRDVTYEDILTLNEMYELMTVITNPVKRIHLRQDIIHSISKFFPQLEGKEIYFEYSPSEHCNGFAAVGNATKDGKIVISDAVWCGGWWYTYYIAQRWNVILDIEPDKGHRVIMATSPGLIWSDEDYWQNDAGIAMIETTFIQGYYKLKGLPLSVRARMAMQYGNNIDDVIASLLNENNGIMNAQWLIADAQKNEIALLEFGLYHHAIKRTRNGFLWSANNPFDFRVRREIIGYEFLKSPIYRMAHLILNVTGYQYYTLFYTPSERDIKFEELGKKNYGKIDTEVVKKIMSTPPISDFTTYIEITDGEMIRDNGLWGFYGNPNYVWNTSSLYKLKGVRDVPGDGWVKIYCVPKDFEPAYRKGNMNKGMSNTPLWTYVLTDDENTSNYMFAHLGSDGKIAYAFFGSMLIAFDENGSILWKKDFHENIINIDVGEKIYVMTYNSTYIIDKKGNTRGQAAGIPVGDRFHIGIDGFYDGKEKVIQGKITDFTSSGNEVYMVSGKSLICYKNGIRWYFNSSLPFEKVSYYNGRIYASCWDGNLYCLNEKGNLLWKYTAGWGIVTQAVEKNEKVFFGSLDGNLYCLNTDGKLQWIYSSNASIHGNIAVYGDFIFFGSDDGRFYAINSTTGKAEWSFAPAYEMKGLYNYITTPVLSNAVELNGKILFSANGRIYCMNAGTYEREEFIKKGDRWVIFPFVIFAIAIVFYITYKKIGWKV